MKSFNEIFMIVLKVVLAIILVVFLISTVLPLVIIFITYFFHDLLVASTLALSVVIILFCVVSCKTLFSKTLKKEMPVKDNNVK